MLPARRVDLQGFSTSVAMCHLAHDPGLIPRHARPEHGFSVDPEVEGQIGIDHRAADDEFVL